MGERKLLTRTPPLPHLLSSPFATISPSPHLPSPIITKHLVFLPFLQKLLLPLLFSLPTPSQPLLRSFNPHTLQITESETLRCQSLLSVTLLHLLSASTTSSTPPNLVFTNINQLSNHCLLNHTLHHASLYHRPIGLATHSFALRSQSWPNVLHPIKWCDSCPD